MQAHELSSPLSPCRTMVASPVVHGIEECVTTPPAKAGGFVRNAYRNRLR